MTDATFTPRLTRGRFAKALVLENPDPVLDARLGELGIEVDRVADAPDEDRLVALLQAGQHDLIFKRSKVEITERVVTASDNLAAVMLCCIGDDSVDKVACARHGVLVMNDPISNGRSVAELVIGELIMLARRIFDAVIEMNDSVWKKNNRLRFEVAGKTIGILGFGNIGRQVAQLARAMEMDVVFYDSAELPREVGVAMGYEPCRSMVELFERSDFISVHVSATDARGRSNRNLVTRDCFEAMARGRDADSPRAFLNLARGVVVDPEVLVQAVREGLVHHAITDVFPEEPGKATTATWRNPYADEPHIFATPHIGAATREAQPRIARRMARTTQLFSERGMIRNCVLRPRSDIRFEAEGARCMLAVVHADTRGTKKAVDDAIYQSGANNLRSAHVDFPAFGIAYDLSALDRDLDEDQLEALVEHAVKLTGDPTAVRWIRTIPLDSHDD